VCMFLPLIFYHFIAFIIIIYLLWTFLCEIKPD